MAVRKRERVAVVEGLSEDDIEGLDVAGSG